MDALFKIFTAYSALSTEQLFALIILATLGLAALSIRGVLDVVKQALASAADGRKP